MIKAEKEFKILKTTLNIDIDNNNIIIAKDYENLCRKLENDIRQHISLENQLKLHNEKLNEQIEELKKDNSNLFNTIEKYKKKLENIEEKNTKINNLEIDKKNLKKKI